MDKLKMHSPDGVNANIERIAELFPTCVTESRDDTGKVTRAIDFDLLRQELSDRIVEGPQERYRLDWPGKREALLAANAPIAKTLRPCREESVDFDTTQNLFIEGDNLDALKLLQETYLGKVKMIYIDPPYNTGSDLVYEDDFSNSTQEYLERSNQLGDEGRLVANTDANGRFHSDWLSMMYPRLQLAKHLLKDDGVICISIDDAELPRLRGLCDEVFGSDNFVECFTWKRRYGGGAKEKHIVSIHEYIVVYTRSLTALGPLFIALGQAQIERYYKLRDDQYKKFGPYRLQPLEPADSMADRPNLRFAVIAPDGTEVWPRRQWLWGKEKFVAAAEAGRLDFKKTDSGWQVSRKQYLRDADGVQRQTKMTSIIDGIYGQSGSATLKQLFDDNDPFPFSKPWELIAKLIDVFTDDGDLVLDFFAGSGSTGHAVYGSYCENLNKRSFLLVQLDEPVAKGSVAEKSGYQTVAKISIERLRRAGAKIKADNAGKEGIDKLDVGFRVLKIDTSNMAEVYYKPDELKQDDLLGQVDNVKPDRTAEDLLFQVLLDWGVDLSLPIVREKIAGREVFFVDGNALAACFVADGSVDEAFVKELAKRKPLRVVFRDKGFASDNARINVEQIFKTLSPDTEVRTL
jgi:adenine-specific DNA-methyltransferase